MVIQGKYIPRNINKILKLGVESFTVNDRSIKVGQPLGVFSGYVFDGVVQQGEENATPVPVWETDGVQAGEARYKDINGDEIINGSDRVNLGNVHPDFI
ncbi:MAG: hypothetical protein LBG45_03490 [Dysgonamonadaceae bacterium]|nr:hypothetical protein [Dysgonamonadaceae bacterium]